MKADSITDNRARLSGGRKKFNGNLSVIVVFYKKYKPEFEEGRLWGGKVVLF